MLNKVTPGQAVSNSASDYNAFVDAAIYVKQQNGGGVGTAGAATAFDGLTVKVKNETDDRLPRFAAVMLDEPVTMPDADKEGFRRAVCMRAILPTSKCRRWAILLQPLEKGAVGVAAITGVIPCKIKLLDETHKSVTVDTVNQTVVPVSCDGGGAKIIWVKPIDEDTDAADATGSQDALIQMGDDAPQVWAKLIAQDTTDRTKYAWTQAIRWFNTDHYETEDEPTPITEDDEDDYSGLSGTIADNPAIALDDYPTALTNDFYLLTRGYRVNDDETIDQVWYFRAPDGMYIQITGATVQGGKTNVFNYQWKQVQFTTAGGYADVPAGMTNGSGKYGGAAVNGDEANNTASGVQGNSVDLSGLASTWQLQGVRGNPVVYARMAWSCDDPPVRFWTFNYENAVQGPCP